MSTPPLSFLWHGRPVPFEAGDTLAVALVRAGVMDLGAGPSGSRGRYFCGNGACQNCVVEVRGMGRVEACLTPAAADLDVIGRGTDEAEDGHE